MLVRFEQIGRCDNSTNASVIFDDRKTTGATSRVIAWSIAFWLILLSCLPKFAGLIVHMPRPVMAARLFFNGALISDITLDTSAAATDTIDYVATDSAGNVATSSRTDIIEDPNTGNLYVCQLGTVKSGQARNFITLLTPRENLDSYRFRRWAQEKVIGRIPGSTK